MTTNAKNIGLVVICKIRIFVISLKIYEKI